jgi:hypothetical protein
MTVLQQGVTVIIPGVDAWYRKADKTQDIPIDCRVTDINLAENLGVDFFAVPPAAGINPAQQTEYINAPIFPRWVACSVCKALTKLPDSATSLEPCQTCHAGGKKWAKNIQVNFVSVCESGHLDEFPWVEWVHESWNPSCSNPKLKLESKGSGDLKGQRISCQSCTKSRSMDQTSSSDSEGTFLSRKLNSSGVVHYCSGARPWLRDKDDSCGNQIRMILRNSNNIYYSATADSILVPPKGIETATLKDLVEPKIHIYTARAAAFKYNYEKLVQWMTLSDAELFEGVDEAELLATVKILIPNKAVVDVPDVDDLQSTIKEPEWEALNTFQENTSLTVRSVSYEKGSIPGIANIAAVPVLNKTTALRGFTRLIPGVLDLAEGKKLLRRNPFAKNSNWLPAVRHVGEGIFFTLDEAKLKTWEKQPALISRMSTIEQNLAKYGHLTLRNTPTPRSVLLHTLAHILIQELVLECGYTAAALAERIYSGDDKAGILIYTASADADGTMGGLVEMSDPKIFGRALANAIANAQWCSNDPVCMELGEEGQGHHGTNLSACHSCCLLPETACQNFNQALDRATLIGDLTAKGTFSGFFS